MYEGLNQEDFRLKILLIEDDPVMRTFMRVILLNERNIEVEVAADGREGLEKFFTYKPDMVIVDLTMPIVDGFAVIEQIREKYNEDVWMPIVVVSSSDSEEEPLRAFRLGADEFLVKPVQKEILLRKVINFRRVLGLQRNNQHLAMQVTAVTNDINVGLITTDHTGVVNWCNHSANCMFGICEAELEGLHLTFLLEGMADFDFEECRMTGALEVNGMQRLRMMATREDGESFPVEVSASRLIVRGESMCSFELRDLTDIERIEEMKREFLSVVNHELRTPLTSINGALSILMSGRLGALPDKAARMVELAHRNGLRLHRLINDILDFEKIEEGKLEVHLAPHNIHDLMQTGVVAMEGLARSSKVNLSLKSTLKPLMVAADPDRLEQVVTNLISNAIKFSPEGAKVETRVRREGDSVLVEVQDWGSGIPDNFTSRIFTRFSQADKADTRAKGGSGLGLAISKKLVEAMGGVIGFHSQEGKGSTFYFTLPLLKEDVCA